MNLATVREAVRRAGAVRRLETSFVWRCVLRFLRMDGRNRAFIVAAQAFITMIPLLILLSGIAGDGGSDSVSQELIRRFHLRGFAAEAVRDLFEPPDSTMGTLSAVGAVVLFFSLMTFARSLQRTFEAAWELPAVGVRGTLWALSATVLLIAQVALLALLTSALRPLPGGSAYAFLLRAAVAVPAWLGLQHLLLSRRMPTRALLPGAVVMAAGQAVLSVGSAIYMPHLVGQDAARYGDIGVTFALLSWLLVVALLAVAGAVVSAELATSVAPDGEAADASTGPEEDVEGGPETMQAPPVAGPA